MPKSHVQRCIYLTVQNRDSKDLTIGTAVAAGQSEGPTHGSSKATAQEGAGRNTWVTKKKNPWVASGGKLPFWGKATPICSVGVHCYIFPQDVITKIDPCITG